MSHWQYVPDAFQYLKPLASEVGLRGLTVYFGEQPRLGKLASKRELAQLRTAYKTIAERRDGPAISAWCLSIQSDTPANEVKEEIRGLLLLFERLGERGLMPFADGRVRFVSPDPPPFDWSVLPSYLREWEFWLRKYEGLRTEHDLYEYVGDATEDQVRSLAALTHLVKRDGKSLLAWCETNNVKGNPAKNEAFHAELLFVLVDFARSRVQNLSSDSMA